ncbi:hypothetical protein [Geodermatophilus sabuli]|nr:hypothetical protein [Geodermatophilus sabuli]
MAVDLREQACHPGITQTAPTVPGAQVTTSRSREAVLTMAKALFGHVVAPAELRVVEENAVLRAKVRRLEQELEELRAQRDAAIAHELLSMAGENAEPALA